MPGEWECGVFRWLADFWFSTPTLSRDARLHLANFVLFVLLCGLLWLGVTRVARTTSLPRLPLTRA